MAVPDYNLFGKRNQGLKHAVNGVNQIKDMKCADCGGPLLDGLLEEYTDIVLDLATTFTEWMEVGDD